MKYLVLLLTYIVVFVMGGIYAPKMKENAICFINEHTKLKVQESFVSSLKCKFK